MPVSVTVMVMALKDVSLTPWRYGLRDLGHNRIPFITYVKIDYILFFIYGKPFWGYKPYRIRPGWWCPDFKIPSSKHQITNKSQYPNKENSLPALPFGREQAGKRLVSVIGYWNLELVWDLAACAALLWYSYLGESEFVFRLHPNSSAESRRELSSYAGLWNFIIL